MPENNCFCPTDPGPGNGGDNGGPGTGPGDQNGYGDRDRRNSLPWIVIGSVIALALGLFAANYIYQKRFVATSDEAEVKE